MFRAILVRRAVSCLGFVGLVLLSAAPVQAQSTGQVRGRVMDLAGKPVEGATILIEFQGGVTRKFEAKTNKNGEFVQIGLGSGMYKVTAQKEGVGNAVSEVRVALGRPADVTLQLGAAAAAADAAAAAELKNIFDEAVALSKAGQFDQAIAKFQAGLAVTPQCADCWYNIGVAHGQKKEYEQAEAAFKKALEVDPAYADAYSGLANIYNFQRRFDDAAKMSAEATKLAAAGGGGGSAESTFNQGIIFWNAGKIAEAKQQFEATLQVDPNHAEANYWLGMANVNEGKLPEALALFQKYLQLAPDGQYAAQAKGIVDQLKK